MNYNYAGCGQDRDRVRVSNMVMVRFGGSYGLSHAVLALCSHYAVLVVCIASFLRNTG